MTDSWDRAAKSFREAMLDWTRRHRPDYAILARTAWDEEWAVEYRGGDKFYICVDGHGTVSVSECGLEVQTFMVGLLRDPRFLEAGKR